MSAAPKRRILIIDGHPDPEPARFVHALADAYAAGAAGAHEVRRADIAKLDFPLLRSQTEWKERPLPASLQEAQEAIGWADHIVFLYPMWLGDLPALFKGFLEQVVRPDFAFRYGAGLPEKLLKGKSARIIVTMGMPAFFYRLVYRAHSLKSFRRNILNFVGIKPVRMTVIGAVEGDAGKRQRWLGAIRVLGAKGC
jgi:putative NADPH-quinone reductase